MDRVDRIVQKLVKDYAFSSQANYRKGGLLCLAAAAVALAEQNKVGGMCPCICMAMICDIMHSHGSHVPAGNGLVA